MNRIITFLIAAVFCAVAVTAWGADKGVNKMKSTLRKEVQGEKGLAPKVKTFVIKSLLPSIDNPEWVKAVEEQNSKGMSLAQIQETDKAWVKAEEMLPIQKALMNNACASEISKLAKKYPAILEAFVTDNQGANVCLNNLTSDYWQGDEAKWKNSFKGGKGGVDVGKVSFDKSANANIQQVSLPILGKGGKVIGAVTFGLSVDQT